jgi:hypothetical protein
VVLSQTQQHRVVDDATVDVGVERELALRGVSMLVKVKASGPVISTCRSTATSHKVTSLTSFQYSETMSS